MSTWICKWMSTCPHMMSANVRSNRQKVLEIGVKAIFLPFFVSFCAQSFSNWSRVYVRSNRCFSLKTREKQGFSLFFVSFQPTLKWTSTYVCTSLFGENNVPTSCACSSNLCEPMWPSVCACTSIWRSVYVRSNDQKQLKTREKGTFSLFFVSFCTRHLSWDLLYMYAQNTKKWAKPGKTRVFLYFLLVFVHKYENK